uniref:GIR1-like zinc ribbon domain-containing protein n=1 Tax=Cucumis melo TaxID=3656 RepID=A0A9I9DG71_CUCME
MMWVRTGEIYYINWRNGMKAKEDPRSTIIDEDYQDDEYSEDYCYYYSDENHEEEEEDDDISSYDSEESSTESTNMMMMKKKKKKTFVVEEGEEEKDVLVVGGCKRCLMYFMVPKHLQDCPKCNNGQLLHFDRSQNHIIP